MSATRQCRGPWHVLRRMAVLALLPAALPLAPPRSLRALADLPAEAAALASRAESLLRDRMSATRGGSDEVSRAILAAEDAPARRMAADDRIRAEAPFKPAAGRAVQRDAYVPGAPGPADVRRAAARTWRAGSSIDLAVPRCKGG